MENFLAPSILAGNHANLIDALNLVENDGRKWIHLDIMDGHFVQICLTQIVGFKEKIKPVFDVHLIDNPQYFVDPFIEAGADLITIHIEPDIDHIDLINRIKTAGKKVGLALNPQTPIDDIIQIIEKTSLDLLLCMTVNPGFGGQSFIFDVLEKVKKLSQLRSENSYNYKIEVDGGVCPEHVEDCKNAGVNIFVAGTAYFKGNKIERDSFASSVGEIS